MYAENDHMHMVKLRDQVTAVIYSTAVYYEIKLCTLDETDTTYTMFSNIGSLENQIMDVPQRLSGGNIVLIT